MSKGIFITGTGTDIGKTYVTGLLLKKLNENSNSCAYYKAAMSGNERDNKGNLIPGDAVHVKKVSGITQPIEEMCPYVYETAVSPHLASRIESCLIDMNIVKENYIGLTSKYEYIIAEGSGGIVCPLRYDNNKIFLKDVIKTLNIPCLIIADAGLGTINNVVLTVEYMNSHNIPVKGIILNHYHDKDVMEEDNKKMCEVLTGVPVIACVRDNSSDIDLSGEYIASLCE